MARAGGGDVADPAAPPTPAAGAMRIMFVEDDLGYRDELSHYLLANGLAVEGFSDLRGLAAALEREPNALVLLDLKVSDQDGMDFLRGDRRPPNCPCVVLSANEDESARIIGLELGADDFIVKTTRPREILARLRAVMRRSAPPAGPDAPPPPSPPRTDWRFLPDKRDLLRPDGSSVGLTTAEFNLLAALVQHQGQAMRRADLFGVVFGRPFNPLDRAIDNLVMKLRVKLGDPVDAPVMIRTVRLVGYIFTGFPPAEPGGG